MTAVLTDAEPAEWTTGPAEAPAAPTLGVHPHTNPAGFYDVRVVAETPDAKRALHEILQRGFRLAPAELESTRETFFALGEGANFLGLVQRVKDAEAAATAASTDVIAQRVKWQDAISDDDAELTTKLETAIAKSEATAARLASRLPVLRGERDRMREIVVDTLKLELAGVLTDVRTRAEAREAAARSALAAAVVGPFLEWAAASAEVSSVEEVLVLRLIDRLARVE